MRHIRLLLVVVALSVGSIAVATRAASTDTCHHGAPLASIEDPDPAECVFCGGNPQTHVRTIFALERTSMALHTALLR